MGTRTDKKGREMKITTDSFSTPGFEYEGTPIKVSSPQQATYKWWTSSGGGGGGLPDPTPAVEKEDNFRDVIRKAVNRKKAGVWVEVSDVNPNVHVTFNIGKKDVEVEVGENKTVISPISPINLATHLNDVSRNFLGQVMKTGASLKITIERID